MSDKPYSWHPMSLPQAVPVPMLDPTPIDLPHPVGLDPATATLMGVGQGFVHTDLRWMWSWDTRGLLRLFTAWSGYESYRLQMEPVTLAPGPTAWRAATVLFDASNTRATRDAGGSAFDTLSQVLATISHAEQYIEGRPSNREIATSASLPPDSPGPAALDVLADSINDLLPAPTTILHLRGRPMDLPHGLQLMSAHREIDSVCLTFSDDSRLWLQHPWRTNVHGDGLQTQVHGALLWPGRRWAISPLVTSWGMARGSSSIIEVARSEDGEEVPMTKLPPAREGELELTVALDVARGQRGAHRRAGADTGGPRQQDPRPAQQHLMDVGRCPIVAQVREGCAPGHPCSSIVNNQAHVPLPLHQGPEPWTGHLDQAKVLFVSSNPSYGEDDAYPRWSAPTTDLVDYFESRFDGGPGQIADGAYLVAPDGTRKYIQFWGSCLRVVQEVLPDARPGVDYALTEVVRCKSKMEIGVLKARSQCADLYLHQTLTQAANANLVVIFGKHAVTEMNQRYGLALSTDARHGIADIAGRLRWVVWLDHPASARKVRLHRVLTETELTELRSWVAAPT